MFNKINSLLNLIKINLDKELDLVSTNSGNTWDKTLNNYYTLYTATKNDTIMVNYGDSTQQVIQLNSGRIFFNFF